MKDLSFGVPFGPPSFESDKMITIKFGTSALPERPTCERCKQDDCEKGSELCWKCGQREQFENSTKVQLVPCFDKGSEYHEFQPRGAGYALLLGEAKLRELARLLVRHSKLYALRTLFPDTPEDLKEDVGLFYVSSRFPLANDDCVDQVVIVYAMRDGSVLSLGYPQFVSKERIEFLREQKCLNPETANKLAAKSAFDAIVSWLPATASFVRWMIVWSGLTKPSSTHETLVTEWLCTGLPDRTILIWKTLLGSACEQLLSAIDADFRHRILLYLRRKSYGNYANICRSLPVRFVRNL